MEQTVFLSKDYEKLDGECYTVEGQMQIKANSQREAEEIVNGYMVSLEPLQTIDPRIVWDTEPGEGDRYIDWSFNVVSN